MVPWWGWAGTVGLVSCLWAVAPSAQPCVGFPPTSSPHLLWPPLQSVSFPLSPAFNPRLACPVCLSAALTRPPLVPSLSHPHALYSFGSVTPGCPLQLRPSEKGHGSTKTFSRVTLLGTLQGLQAWSLVASYRWGPRGWVIRQGHGPARDRARAMAPLLLHLCSEFFLNSSHGSTCCLQTTLLGPWPPTIGAILNFTLGQSETHGRESSWAVLLEKRASQL